VVTVKMSFLIVASALFYPVIACSSVIAQESFSPASSITNDTYDRIMSQPSIKMALEFIKTDHENTITEQKQISTIPAPSFKEQKRGEDYLKRLVSVGVNDVRMDSEGNVCGLLPGSSKGPTLLFAAHLDTVFPEGTDTTVREKNGRLYGPGIGDDARGLALILSVARAFKVSGIKTIGAVMVCGNVGEEGIGDLRGVKALFRDHQNIDGFISIDTPDDVSGITYLATGSHRYEITYKGPGGHSFEAFGLPNATHALGRAIAHIADMQVPKQPKTTYAVGIVKGGTSVNSIAAEASMLVDMRSDSETELLALEKQFLDIVRNAAAEENNRWGSNKMTVGIKLIGNRPAGSQPADAIIVQTAWASALAIGVKPALTGAKSTDSNLPINLGIPAVTLGGGGKDGENHSPGEWYDPTDAYLGAQRVFLSIVGLVGMEGVSEPLLPRRR